MKIFDLLPKPITNDKLNIYNAVNLLVLCASDDVVVVIACPTAAALFIKISLHSSGVSCSDPMGDKYCVPFLSLVCAYTVCVFVSNNAFAPTVNFKETH